MRSAVRIAAATAAFAVLHSLLASRKAKQVAGRVVGERNRQSLYRSAFVAQSVVTSAALAEYVRRQPDRTLYDLPAPWRYFSRAAQVACVGMTFWAAREAGIARLSGLEGFQAWNRGSRALEEPAAQGPSADASGGLTVQGPFRWSRHPLNFWPWLMFLLNPRMTVNRLSFATAAGCYLALGSVHEESRLVTAHGDKYRRYQKSGVPFYLPRLPLPRLDNNMRSNQVLIHDRTGVATH